MKKGNIEKNVHGYPYKNLWHGMTISPHIKIYAKAVLCKLGFNKLILPDSLFIISQVFFVFKCQKLRLS